jgi:hypothetical protein
MKSKHFNLKQLMGKVMAIFLVSVYALFSVGIIKATHFCMGRQASVALFSKQAKKCPCSIYATEKDSCCDDEHQLIRIENEQKVFSSLSVSLPCWIEFEKLYTKRLITSVETASHWSDQPDHSPPPKIPLWKFHCSIILYDDRVIG